MMDRLTFGISLLLGFVVWGMIGARYLWPALRGKPRNEALRLVLLVANVLARQHPLTTRG